MAILNNGSIKLITDIVMAFRYKEKLTCLMNVERLWTSSLRRIVVFVCFVFFTFSSVASYSANINALKAVFMFNIVNFIEWPEESFATLDSPIQFCVLNNLRVLKDLRSVINNETIKGRKLEAIEVISDIDMENCHVIFFGASTDQQGPMTLEILAKENILTVGESPDFLPQGGMIYLKHSRKRIQIEISLDSVKNSDLEVSSKLLRLAIIK